MLYKNAHADSSTSLVSAEITWNAFSATCVQKNILNIFVVPESEHFESLSHINEIMKNHVKVNTARRISPNYRAIILPGCSN